jgi:hypothetical protein
MIRRFYSIFAITLTLYGCFLFYVNLRINNFARAITAHDWNAVESYLDQADKPKMIGIRTCLEPAEVFRPTLWDWISGHRIIAQGTDVGYLYNIHRLKIRVSTFSHG